MPQGFRFATGPNILGVYLEIQGTANPGQQILSCHAKGSGFRTVDFVSATDSIALTTYDFSTIGSLLGGHFEDQPVDGSGHVWMLGGAHVLTVKDGHVGIGTGNPKSILDVRTTDSFTFGATPLAGIQLGTQGTGSSIIIHTPGLSTSYASGLAINGTYNSLKSTINLKAFGTYSGGGYNSDIAFHTSLNTDLIERMRVSSAGQLLIGSTTARVIEVAGTNAAGTTLGIQIESLNTGAYAGLSSIFHSTTAALGPTLYLARTRGNTIGASTIVQSGDNLGGIRWAGGDGTDIRTPAAEITASVDGIPGADDMPGRLIFSTTADGAASLTERMRIDSSGKVGIGTSSPSAKLHVSTTSANKIRLERTGMRVYGDIYGAY